MILELLEKYGIYVKNYFLALTNYQAGFMIIVYTLCTAFTLYYITYKLIKQYFKMFKMFIKLFKRNHNA